MGTQHMRGPAINIDAINFVMHDLEARQKRKTKIPYRIIDAGSVDGNSTETIADKLSRHLTHAVLRNQKRRKAPWSPLLGVKYNS